MRIWLLAVAARIGDVQRGDREMPRHAPVDGRELAEAGLSRRLREHLLEAMVHERQDRIDRAEIGGDLEQVCVADRSARDDVGGHVGAAEAIDRLLGIADQEQRARTQSASEQIHGGSLAGFPAQEPDDLDLQRVGVLELVHQDMTEAARQRLPDVLVPREQVARGVEKVIEIKERSGAFVPAPVLHQLVHLGRKPRRAARLRPRTKVLPAHHGTSS